MAIHTWKLQLRLILAVFGLAFIVYFLLGLIWTFLGRPGGIGMWGIIGLLMIFIQYLISPQLVEHSMGVRYVTKEEAPELYEMVTDLAQKADIPMPKVGICESPVPNAFAYGRTRGDGHVCVTRGILNTVNHDELKAVLGHELGHIKHRDMAVTTLISAVPMICYYLALNLMWSNDEDNNGIIFGVIALFVYFLGQLLVLFVSRTREYYADAASVEFGCKPEHLASALYKLIYGTANCSEESIKDVEGQKAFFLNDVSNAERDISELSQLDLNKDGVLSGDELNKLKNSKIHVSTGNKIMEVLSTHPDTLKRVKKLSELDNT